MEKYEYEFKDMQFSKNGQLDELIALDRYVVTAYEDYKKDDTVVAIVDKDTGVKKIGTITEIFGDGTYKVVDRFGDSHTVKEKLLQKPLETQPYQLWDRWAKAGASVEKTQELRDWFENELRWLFDGYRYSLGGRIQLMLGQEHVTGKRANLTAFNCFVVRSPYSLEKAKEQFLDVVKVAYYEASIMRRGGGVGLNISTINTVSGATINGVRATDKNYIFYLDKDHEDYEELQERILLSKFKGVTVIDNKEDFEKAISEFNARRIVVNDSVDEIFSAVENMVEVSYDGHTVAVDFNKLRARNSIVLGVNGRSSGSVSWAELFVLMARLLQQDKIDNVDFAEIFSAIVHLIIQGGSRRGALMLINNVDNPNIYKFMQRKKQMGFLSGANISVGISDTFMERVLKGKEIINNAQLIVDKEVDDAVKLWNVLIESAWASAEPGIVWLERYNKESNSWYFHEIIATNPCGEQGLPAFGVCNLGHFVMSRFYNKKTNSVDWAMLERAVRIAVRLQDNIIDYTSYFLDENEKTQLSERRVGIGSMGVGTLLIKMGLEYGSNDGNKMLEVLYKFIAETAYKASIKLAEEKGAFPQYEYKQFIQSGFMKRMLEEFPEMHEGLSKHGIRNVTLLTQAPTGSTGTYIDNIPDFRRIFGGTTTGIEPYFSWKYWRAGRLGMNEQTVDLALDYMKKHNLDSVEDLPSYFVTAMDLPPTAHIDVQATIQKWTDSSISKTANCPSDYTIEQTDELYLKSYVSGLKGMTIYRDGSRESQVLAVNKEDAKLETHLEAQTLKKLKEELKEVKVIQSENDKIHKVPNRLFGMREKVKYQSGDKISKAYVHIYVDEDGTPMEVWIEPTEANDKDMADALGRMTTQFLRFGATSNNVEQAIKHLKQGKTMLSLPFIIGRLLNDIQYGKIVMPTFGEKVALKTFELAKCEVCGAQAYDKGNCICNACGQSKCN